MKIGYYIPKLNELKNGSRSIHCSKFIDWESYEAIEFIESLFENKNLTYPNYDPLSKDFKPLFANLKDFLLYAKLNHFINIAENTVSSLSNEWPDTLESNLLKLKREFNLKIDNSNIQDKNFQLIVNSGINSVRNQCEELERLIENHKKKIQSLTTNNELEFITTDELSYFWNFLWEDYIENEIEVRGFKLTEEVYENNDLNYDLGYHYDFLKNDMALLKDFNNRHRNNSCEILNKFYKIIRTNNPNDVLYLSRTRSVGSNKIIFVMKSHPYSLMLNSKNNSDYVFFNRFHINPKNNETSIIATDKPITAISHSSDEKVNFGILFIYDPQTADKIKNDHPIIQHLENILTKNYALEGFKLSDRYVYNKNTGNRTGLKFIKTGITTKCPSCAGEPCVCLTIMDWERYRDPKDSANTYRPYWGFSRDKELENGKSPSQIESSYKHHPTYSEAPQGFWESFYDSFSHSNYDGLNWSYYNDQLDMDQQDPEFYN